MRRPQDPPPWRKLWLEADSLWLLSAVDSAERYLPWDEVRRRTPPAGLTHEQWWLGLKMARLGMRRDLPLVDAGGLSFTYALPDEVLRGVEALNRDLSGRIGIPEPVTDPLTRDRYLVSSLIEEAITSSQLEGAATTYLVAKDMLRSGRKPRTVDETMIRNNYVAMRRIGELRDEPLTPALICEIQRIVTEGTLRNPAAAGRFQLPGEERVVVADTYGEVLHTPPPAEQLPERVRRLCDFANGVSQAAYIPPVIRAIAVHFMLAYDHPFEDGNGRTARALFYWSMLNQDYWLTEFISISRILKNAPARYGRSFLHVEQDENDLTYFVLCQLGVLRRAVDDLHAYLGRKAEQAREVRASLARGRTGAFNGRQIALLTHAGSHPVAEYTVAGHAASHQVVLQTARTDLRDLEQRGLLTKVRRGRADAWIPADDLTSRLRNQ
ncbi:Fic family protein [Nonomuraea guangzhouensis]|uniref:Fic family protein n=1 Tax=Nonomuraea guangzhouensis TaxID=1291555 RepID=A0ABW4G0I3_9ACTN|nr:Fic family protein [Nonomuraea guangzhouensis]